MGEKRENADQEQEQEPLGKSPRLDLQGGAAAAAGAAADSGRGEAVAPPEASNLREERAEEASDNKQCNHAPAGSAHVEMLRSSAFSQRAGTCERCDSPFLGADILVCLECGRYFCSGVGSVEYPYGHSRLHAQEEKHWVAALSENPESAFCFKCDCVTDGPRGTIPGKLARAEVDFGSSEPSWSEPCNHAPTDNAHKEMLSMSLISEHAGMCVHCKTFKESGILVCMECGRHFCVGLGSYDCPSGHSLLHAKQKQHWVAALYDEPESAYCFKCEYVVCLANPPDDMETDGYVASDDAVKLSDEDRNLCRGLPNAFTLIYVRDYAIRGMPNLGNTCYLNAVVQCFLVLDKLRERMLAPDALKGLFADALAELFVGASAAESLLDPEKLLTCVRWYKKDFQEYEMHDSHELLMSLLGALDEEEIRIYRHAQDASTIIKSIFGFKMYETRICKCLSNSVSHPDFLDLSLTLASQIHPAEKTALRRTIENIKSQLEKVATQILPANNQSKSERIQTVSKSGDSHLPCSELKDVVMEETPGPLDVDSSKVQRICQSKDAVQGPSRTQEDTVTCPELSERITEMPVKSASLPLLSMFDVKDKEMNETTADSVASIEDCLSLFLAELLEWRCDNCSKVFKELSTNQCKNDEQVTAGMEETTTFHGNQGEQSNMTTCKNDQPSGSNSLPVESKSSSSRQPHCSDAQDQIIQTEKVTGTTKLGQHSEDISIQIKMYQEKKKQIELDRSACQFEDKGNEQKDCNGHAIQTRRFLKLPPVLTLHIRRSNINGLKITDHVRYKEYLDVEPFTDPSSVDKANFIYRLVGVVEHRGTESVEKGHYVAYVRARKLELGTCSHSWFCADDRTISEVSLEDVLKREAYILFYERMEG